MRKDKTQIDYILEHFEEFDTITPLDALMEYGIMRLSSRIYELKRMGYIFDVKMIASINIKGKKVRYAQYTLLKKG